MISFLRVYMKKSALFQLNIFYRQDSERERERMKKFRKILMGLELIIAPQA